MPIVKEARSTPASATTDRLKNAIRVVTTPEKVFEGDDALTLENQVLHLRELAEAANDSATEAIRQTPGALTMTAVSFAKNNSVGSLSYVIRAEHTTRLDEGRTYTDYSAHESHWSAVGLEWGNEEFQFKNLGVYRFMGMADDIRGIFIPLATAE